MILQASREFVWRHRFRLAAIVIIAGLDYWCSQWILSRIFWFDNSYEMDFRSWLILHIAVLLGTLGAARLLLGPGQLARQLPGARAAGPGTAGWLSGYQARKVFGRKYNEKGIFFGLLGRRPLILPEHSGSNRNVVVVGPPGSMKSRAYIRNNIFQCVSNGWSILVTDPKGELTAEFAAFLKEAGYHVRVLNLVNPANSHQWNPLAEIHNEADVQLVAEIVIANTQAEYLKGDPFWERAELNLLKALLFLTAWNKLQSGETVGTLADVYQVLCSGSLDAIDRHFASLTGGHPALSSYKLFKISNHNVQCGVVAGLGARLQIFQIPEICHLTSTSSIQLEAPGQHRCAYFCVIPDTGRSYHFLSSLFISSLMNRLIRQADALGSPLPVPVCALLDEFCNIGKIPDFMLKLSTMRSRNLFCSIILQSLVQLKEMYGDVFEVILAQCDSWLILGVNDFTSADYISRCIGETSRDARSYGRRMLHIADAGTVLSRDEARLLIKPDELRRMRTDKAILLARRQNPLKLEKMDYTRHPMAGNLGRIQAAGYVPCDGYLGESLNINIVKVMQSTDETGTGANEKIPFAGHRANKRPASRPRLYCRIDK